MKILWHMPTLSRSGCGLSLRAVELASHLATIGHQVSLVVDRSRTSVKDGELRGLPVRFLDLPTIRPIHWSLQALARRSTARAAVTRITVEHDLFISCQPEVVSEYARVRRDAAVVYVCGGTTLLHDAADAERLRHEKLSTRICAAVDRHLKHASERSAFELCDAAVFNSHHTRRRVIREYGIAADHCHTIHGGVDPERFRPCDAGERAANRDTLGIRQEDFVVTFTGRLSSEKNIRLLLNAIAVCEHRPDLLCIVGDGPLRSELRAIADQLGLAGCVRFVGNVDDVRPYLCAADVFAFPSVSESFGDALLEAMACGLPCVALQPDDRRVRNATMEIFDEGRCGLVVDSPTAQAFALAIDRLRQSPQMRRHYGDRARSRAATKFAWQRAGEEFAELIAGLVMPSSLRVVREGMPSRLPSMCR